MQFFFNFPKLVFSVTSINVNDIETKAQTFRYRSLLSERDQKVLMCYKNYCGTFLFYPKSLNRNQNVLMSSRIVLIQSGTFPFNLKTFGKTFWCVPESFNLNSNPGGYKKVHWVAALSLLSLLDGSRSCHQLPRIAMLRIMTAGQGRSMLPEGQNFGCPLMKEKHLDISVRWWFF